ncbi:hypothetical protein BDN72DRAFT_429375 [Pluteus cervinus]|uniref:Uncharacterized protein n=1 Tax=Pluteus cervinus TaxID=181527 RepID=A0ACD3A8Q8_9AGAR|nr:hypothetical protein BDN72DRAFT_429375 [Pluteus cervinus]
MLLFSHSEPPIRCRTSYYPHWHIQRLFSCFPLCRAVAYTSVTSSLYAGTFAIRNVFPSTYGSSSGYHASFGKKSRTSRSFGAEVVPGMTFGAAAFCWWRRGLRALLKLLAVRGLNG